MLAARGHDRGVQAGGPRAGRRRRTTARCGCSPGPRCCAPGARAGTPGCCTQASKSSCDAPPRVHEVDVLVVGRAAAARRPRTGRLRHLAGAGREAPLELLGPLRGTVMALIRTTLMVFCLSSAALRPFLSPPTGHRTHPGLAMRPWSRSLRTGAYSSRAGWSGGPSLPRPAVPGASSSGRRPGRSVLVGLGAQELLDLGHELVAARDLRGARPRSPARAPRRRDGRRARPPPSPRSRRPARRARRRSISIPLELAQPPRTARVAGGDGLPAT